MFAIASLLDRESDQAVRSIWERFEVRCGLTGVKMAPLPHFSWQGAEKYEIEPVEYSLGELAKEIEPFTVRTTGLGLFTGPQPVVYIALVKDETLLKIHQMIWERITQYARIPNGYYAPGNWVPHVTLAFHEIDAERIGCAVADAAFQKIDLKMRINNFAIIYQHDGLAGLHNMFRLKPVSEFVGGEI